MKGMTQGERKATTALASIFALRMLGLFMIIPVFAIYGKALTGATPALIGLAIGIYGLTQAILQIPVGLLADRINRKNLIIAGLLLFAVGGAVAALSTTIQGVILGRAIQGSGAISAVVMALLADLTREEQRTKAMSTIGMSIGLSFAVAFILGPLVAAHFGLSGLFWATSILAILGLVLLNCASTDDYFKTTYRLLLAAI
jgi:MFS family permease